MMFSPTTTASSTTIPITMISANSDTMLMFTPRYGNSRKAPMNEMGTPIATQNASRRSSISTRNRKTRAKPRVPLRSSRLRRPARISVWSAQTAMSKPSGGSRVAMCCLIASAISMASSASDFCTRTKMLSRPSYRLIRSTSANPSRMTATSASRRMLPSGAARSTMSSNSSPVSRFALVRSSRSPAPVRISPDDRLRDDARTAAATWLMDRSWRRRASSRTSMAISYSRVPSSSTSETSGSASNSCSSHSAACRRDRSPRSDATTRVMTSLMVSATTMSTSSASSGGKSEIRSTAVSMSLRTLISSTRSLSSTCTTPMFSEAVEDTRSTPSMPSVASSTRRVMPSSTSDGVAPG